MKRFRIQPVLAAAILAILQFPISFSQQIGNVQRERQTPTINLQQIDYAQRERQAPPTVRATLATLRNEIQAKQFSFQVGYTLAADRQLEQLAGLKPPANLPAMANQQNRLADQLVRIDNASRDEYARLNPNVRLPELTLQCNASARSFDWRRLGKVTAVRDQGGCGSCWAFATVGAYEGSYLIRNGGSPDASEQDVLSCSGLGSCAGGWWAFDFLLGKGDAAEASYPYTATDSPCNAAIPDPYWAVSWAYVKPGGATPTVAEMKQALCQYGPLAVAVRVTTAFKHYTSGVFNEMAAGSVNHGVTLIGWDDTKGAWLIKNSWGTGWGDPCGYGTQKGYMWIAYGSNNIGYAAAWVRARNRYYKLPDTYYKLIPVPPKFIPTSER